MALQRLAIHHRKMIDPYQKGVARLLYKDSVVHLDRKKLLADELLGSSVVRRRKRAG